MQYIFGGTELFAIKRLTWKPERRRKQLLVVKMFTLVPPIEQLTFFEDLIWWITGVISRMSGVIRARHL
jgi:hypothetical protein